MVEPPGATRSNPFLDRLRAGEPTLVLGIRSSRTSDVVRVAHATGHHGLMIDLEHSTMPLDVAAVLCGTAGDLGMTPFVRIPERDYGAIGRLLDCGAHGIVAPRVEEVADAELISRACRFPPHGQRSQLAMVPQYGMRPTPASELNPALDAATIVQILLETPKGIGNADGIAALDGVDMLAIGCNDLTAELGIPGQYGHSAVREAIVAAGEACKRHGKLLMVGGISDRAVVDSLPALGVSPVHLTGFDTDLLFSAAKARAAAFIEPGVQR